MATTTTTTTSKAAVDADDDDDNVADLPHEYKQRKGELSYSVELFSGSIHNWYL